MRKDNISIIISILSLFVAILAITIPYYQNKSKEKEIINTNIKLDENGKIIYLNDNVVQFPFNITISNNSLVPLSIMDYDFYQFDYNREGYIFDGIKGKYLPIDNVVIKFPIYLESGKSIKFKTLVGYRITLKDKNLIDVSMLDVEKQKILDISNWIDIDEKEENIPIYLIGIKTSRNNVFYEQFVIGTAYTPLTEKDVEHFSSQNSIKFIDLEKL